MWIETRGNGMAERMTMQFIRQQWRMWIETPAACGWPLPHPNSFASNGECGLKPMVSAVARAQAEFIRQQWRMWIETQFISEARCNTQ